MFDACYAVFAGAKQLLVSATTRADKVELISVGCDLICDVPD